LKPEKLLDFSIIGRYVQKNSESKLIKKNPNKMALKNTLFYTKGCCALKNTLFYMTSTNNNKQVFNKNK
jgi:hypothetical protein